MFLSLERDQHCPPVFVEKLPVLTATSVLNPTVHTRLKEELATVELLLHVKNDKTVKEIDNLKCDLQLNGYPLKVIYCYRKICVKKLSGK
jgi:hypothetical protein